MAVQSLGANSANKFQIKTETASLDKSILSPEFERPSIPKKEKDEGTEADRNVLTPQSDPSYLVNNVQSLVLAICTKIDTEDPNGNKKSYFVKGSLYDDQVPSTGNGRIPVHEGLAGCHPRQCATAYCFGRPHASQKQTFSIAVFKDLKEDLEVPPIQALASVIANLHNSISPDGKFGFQVPTSQSQQLENTWCDTWEEFCVRAFRNTVKLEQEVQGANEDLHCWQMKSGRKPKPTFLHGDLWHGNIGIDLVTDQVVLYDCCAFYGHHEYDLGMFRASRYRTSRAHIRAYNQLVGFSDPSEDFDDRNALYALRVDLEVSCGWPANKRMRQLAMQEMRRLVEKYPAGFEGWQEEEKGS
ncbi:uncharacterized protein Z519_08642 [Cladophialophora bantiana CBS 173.52]|uniref:protein-ribulosamine 3-kinase n=1 Tax=Cladophialophora bantiana (strain ATCC 10958 / CBS 173.52 / CDC B-1940 / NIH 8579) TaxID=1442370 RepID=A0A0D2I1T8_CLAB1|nr:uncharacterized protein Z519_08642 [Cladophialophora bantiana CBS 173.52]KIW90859.1 hypothetical protein Z519_08642 [Cladophialophora bantiana CBS 173.52]